MTQLRVATITDPTFQIQQSAKAKQKKEEVKRAHPSPRLSLQIAREETESKGKVAK